MKVISEKMLDDINLSFKIYRENVESLISIHDDTRNVREEKIAKLDREIKEWSEKNTGRNLEDLDSIRDDWLDEYFNYKHHFDYLLIHSLFISIFSMFESHLNRIVEILDHGSGSKIKPKDIRGNGDIDAFRKYIFLVFNISSASSDLVEWGEILEYKAIRNALVHSGCLLNKDLKKNYDKVKGYKKIVEHDIWHSSDAIYLRIRNVAPLRGFFQSTTKFLERVHGEIKETCITQQSV